MKYTLGMGTNITSVKVPTSPSGPITRFKTICVSDIIVVAADLTGELFIWGKYRKTNSILSIPTRISDIKQASTNDSISINDVDMVHCGSYSTKGRVEIAIYQSHTLESRSDYCSIAFLNNYMFRSFKGVTILDCRDALVFPTGISMRQLLLKSWYFTFIHSYNGDIYPPQIANALPNFMSLVIILVSGIVCIVVLVILRRLLRIDSCGLLILLTVLGLTLAAALTSTVFLVDRLFGTDRDSMEVNVVFSSTSYNIVSIICSFATVVLIFAAICSLVCCSTIHCLWYRNSCSRTTCFKLVTATILPLIVLVSIVILYFVLVFVILFKALTMRQLSIYGVLVHASLYAVASIISFTLLIVIRKLVQMYLSEPFTQRQRDKDLLEMLLTNKDYMELKDEVQSSALNKDLFTIKLKELNSLEEIGTGASGVILKGKWAASANQVVAIKLFKGNTQVKQDFIHELRLLCSLRHPNLVAVYGAIMEEPRYGYVMEYCSNGSLYRIIEKQQVQFSLRDRIRILLQIAQGMSFLHSKNVIHRDLKCENILMDDHLCSKIADLGISKVTQDNEQDQGDGVTSASATSSSKASSSMTMAVGSSGHIAPEVYTSENYNNKCDVFSYSIIMFQVLFQICRPYGNVMQIEYKVATDETFRPIIPKRDQLNTGEQAVVNLMQRCWKADPMARPSFVEICEELEKIVEE